jgi:nicotinic acid phosphoribosyltransferase
MDCVGNNGMGRRVRPKTGDAQEGVPEVLKTDSYKFWHLWMLRWISKNSEGKLGSLTQVETHLCARGTKFSHLKNVLVTGTHRAVQCLNQTVAEEDLAILEKVAREHIGFSDEQKSFPLLWGGIVTPDSINQFSDLGTDFSGVPLSQKTFGGFGDIVKELGGNLPIRVTAVEEGTVVGINDPIFTVTNTHAKFSWLPQYVESILMKTWYPVTVSSGSLAIRLVLRHAARLAGVSEQDIALYEPFGLNDFGFRGVSSQETAEIGGEAHLKVFCGTDNVSSMFADRDFEKNVSSAGLSVRATEHSIMLATGLFGEIETIRRFLRGCPTDKILSLVSDTYNFPRALAAFSGTLTEEVNKRMWDPVNGQFGRVVIRPDSGEPTECVIRALLALSLGGYNSKTKPIARKGFGYFVSLPDHIKIILGDGVDFPTVCKTLVAILDEGFDPTDVIYGSGGALLQRLDRDTLQFAIKPHKYVYTDPTTGETTNIVSASKTPIEGSKKSMSNEEVQAKISKQAMVVVLDPLHPENVAPAPAIAQIRQKINKEILRIEAQDKDIINEWLQSQADGANFCRARVHNPELDVPKFTCSAERRVFQELYPQEGWIQSPTALQLADNIITKAAASSGDNSLSSEHRAYVEKCIKSFKMVAEHNVFPENSFIQLEHVERPPDFDVLLQEDQKLADAIQEKLGAAQKETATFRAPQEVQADIPLPKRDFSTFLQLGQDRSPLKQYHQQ